MPSSIIGRPSSVSDKVLRSTEYSKELNGLETISETYTIRTASRISIQPAKGASHSSYSSSIYPYTRMAVETVSIREQDGDLSEMTVTYVGLTSSSGLPPAVIRIVPTAGAGIYGPPVNIQVEFVTDISETQLLTGMHSSAVPIAGGSEYKLIPNSINNTSLPSNPRAPFEFNILDTKLGGTLTEFYLGYVLQDQNCTRRGFFLVATNTYAESRGLRGTELVGSSGFSAGGGKTSKSYTGSIYL